MNLIGWSANWMLAVAQTSADSDDSVWQGWGSVILVCLAIAIVGGFIAMVTWQGMKIAQANTATRVAVAQDEAYRKLASEATAAQRKSAEEQEKMADALTDVRARVTAIETLLRQVE
jgi:hypothetical protein